MKTVNELFYVIIFITFIGSIYNLILIFLQKIFAFKISLLDSTIRILSFATLAAVPTLNIISPEPNKWNEGFSFFCNVWLLGVILLFVFSFFNKLISIQIIVKSKQCSDTRIINIFERVFDNIGIKNKPKLFLCEYDSPACIASPFIRPYILINSNLMAELSDTDIKLILTHELMHMKRKHHLILLLFDFVVILHWFNPIIWLAKRNLIKSCEIDCDNHTLNKVKETKQEYAKTIISVLESLRTCGYKKQCFVSSINFKGNKERIKYILHNEPNRKKVIKFCCVVCVLMFIVVFSFYISRMYFYPYPAYSTNMCEFAFDYLTIGNCETSSQF